MPPTENPNGGRPFCVVLSECTQLTDTHCSVQVVPIQPLRMNRVRRSAGLFILDQWRSYRGCMSDRETLANARLASTRLASAWRRHTAIRLARTQLDRVVLVQTVWRRWVQRQRFLVRRRAAVRIQRALLRKGEDALVVQHARLVHMCRRLGDLRKEHRQLRRAQSRVLESLMESEAERAPDWTRCPISRAPIVTPVFNRADGQFYEREMVLRSLSMRQRSPYNREPNTTADLLEPQQLAEQLRKTSRPTAVLTCSECSRDFSHSQYSSTLAMVRAFCQHSRDMHGVSV